MIIIFLTSLYSLLIFKKKKRILRETFNTLNIKKDLQLQSTHHLGFTSAVVMQVEMSESGIQRKKLIY